eukprot:1313486-Amphidinium_carterae.1
MQSLQSQKLGLRMFQGSSSHCIFDIAGIAPTIAGTCTKRCNPQKRILKISSRSSANSCRQTKRLGNG